MKELHNSIQILMQALYKFSYYHLPTYCAYLRQPDRHKKSLQAKNGILMKYPLPQGSNEVVFMLFGALSTGFVTVSVIVAL